MQTPRDTNNVPTLLAVSETDGSTLTSIVANAANSALTVDDNTTGIDRGPDNAPRDENYVPALLALSSVDGVTPVVVYATAGGKLLIDSN